MKKKDVINLIKFYSEDNDIGFRNEAYEIAKNFNASGDYQLAEYIMALLSNANTFLPQNDEIQSCFLEKVHISNSPLPLPEAIQQDILGIVNAVSHHIGINKFLFQGLPGTGKTESAKQLSRILTRELYLANFTEIVDSKLGQTQKNLALLFKEINSFTQPEKVIILFDEIDSIALDRTNSNDVREMGRATSAMLKGMDSLNDRIILIATTNLFKHIDKALTRRFDSIIDFNRYSQEDLLEIAEIILNNYLLKYKFAAKNIRLFRKIIGLMNPIPCPGDLNNIIRTAVGFSNPEDEFDYLRRLYKIIMEEAKKELKTLQSRGFTVREIETLTGISKSQVSRDLKEAD